MECGAVDDFFCSDDRETIAAKIYLLDSYTSEIVGTVNHIASMWV